MFKSNGQTTREQLQADINALVADTEKLLKAMADESGERADTLRTQIERQLQIGKAQLRELEKSVAGKTKTAARTTETYVREHPWQIIGLTAGLGLLAGLLLKSR